MNQTRYQTEARVLLGAISRRGQFIDIAAKSASELEPEDIIFNIIYIMRIVRYEPMGLWQSDFKVDPASHTPPLAQLAAWRCHRQLMPLVMHVRCNDPLRWQTPTPVFSSPPTGHMSRNRTLIIPSDRGTTNQLACESTINPGVPYAKKPCANLSDHRRFPLRTQYWPSCRVLA